ncbi:MAG: hypothetical protein ACQETE_01115 [Bacteroidota bacterium]
MSVFILVGLGGTNAQAQLLEEEPEPSGFQLRDSTQQAGEAEFILSAGSSVVTNSSGTSLQNEILYHYTDSFAASLLVAYTRLHNSLDNPVIAYTSLDPATVTDEARHYSLVSLNLNMYYTALLLNNHRLMAGGGLGYFVQNRTRIQVRYLETETTTFLSDRTEKGLGFQLSTRYSYRFTDRVSGGLSGHAFFFDETTWNLSLSLLYHL